MHRRGGQAGGLAQVRVAHPAVLKEQLNDALVEILHKAQTYCPADPPADTAAESTPPASTDTHPRPLPRGPARPRVTTARAGRTSTF
ncbi:hypothetical protein GCM10018781_19590 [Kitasatospora indigofera]|uniref:Uncharacterized protein n=1 Tax=Kitasatospora indigofera TaxID=67307 RepID=A0A919FJU9_9ACTN|nr:hypothetical protein GCM10018781_19590 [Kitasatospora indigofera]